MIYVLPLFFFSLVLFIFYRYIFFFNSFYFSFSFTDKFIRSHDFRFFFLIYIFFVLLSYCFPPYACFLLNSFHLIYFFHWSVIFFFSPFRLTLIRHAMLPHHTHAQYPNSSISFSSSLSPPSALLPAPPVHCPTPYPKV